MAVRVFSVVFFMVDRDIGYRSDSLRNKNNNFGNEGPERLVMASSCQQ